MTQGNEPAFTGPSDKGYQQGLTKREYFAAMAMQGLLTSYLESGLFGSHPSFPLVADESVKQADDLIKALNRQS